MKDDLFWAKGGLAQGELQRQQLSQTTTSHGRAPNHFKVQDFVFSGWENIQRIIVNSKNFFPGDPCSDYSGLQEHQPQLEQIQIFLLGKVSNAH